MVVGQVGVVEAQLDRFVGGLRDVGHPAVAEGLSKFLGKDLDEGWSQGLVRGGF